MKIKGKRMSAEIPTASQSDIAFLLIIFFLITTSFAVHSGISMEYPKKDAMQKEVPLDQVGKIELTPDQVVVVGKKVAAAKVREAILAYPFQQIIVTVKGPVTYGRVTDVISVLQARSAEVSLRVAE